MLLDRSGQLGASDKLVDLGGKFVLPGLIDSHTHPTGAAMHEFDHPVPDMETIADVLAYIKSRAEALPRSGRARSGSAQRPRPSSFGVGADAQDAQRVEAGHATDGVQRPTSGPDR